MTASRPCPTREHLQQFLLGQLDEAAAADVERHLPACAQCLQVLETLAADDPLSQAVRDQALATPLPYQDTAERLVSQLSRHPRNIPGEESRDTISEPRPPTQAQIEELSYSFLAPPEKPDEIGRLASYRILKVLGVGGMGVVFLAEDPQLQRLVALKTFKSVAAVNEVNRQRFLREARAAAGIEHDHIVPIYQVGDAQGVPFLAMQLLKGETLDARLKRERRLPVPEVLRIGREVAEGLAAAHDRGLVHRDIKPSNIWLEEGSGRVKLVDFGLVRGSGGDEQLTQEGFIVGTPAYMAPEQARGKPVDKRCDLFSLGCVLYRMASGQQAFQADETLAILTALMTETPRPLSELNPAVPGPLNDLVAQLLAKDPANRPADAHEVIARLRELETAGAALPPSKDTIGGGRRSRQRLYGMAWLVFLVAVPLGAVLLGHALFTPVPESEREVVQNGTPTTAVETRRASPPTGGSTERRPPDPPPKAPGPLSPALALVSEPAALVGASAWTLETRGHRGPIRGLSHSPNGRWLATAGSDGMVRLWDAKTGKLARILVGHNDSVDAVSWSGDSRILATAAHDGTIRLWEAETGKRRQLLRPGSTAGFALSPDAQTVAVCAGKVARLWDVQTGKPAQTLEGPEGNLLALRWSPDGTVLAGGSVDQMIYLWTKGTEQPVVIPGHKDAVVALAWSPDGKQLVSGSRDGTLRLWDVAAHKEVRSYPWQAKGKGAGSARNVVWPPNVRFFVSILSDGVQVWDSKADRTTPVRVIPLAGHSLSVSPDGKSVATVGPDDATVQVWSADNGKPVLSLPGYKEERILGLAWSLNGKRLATRGEHGIQVWSAASGRLERTLEGRGRDVAGLAWSPDGGKLALGGGSKKKLWIHDAATGQLVNTLENKAQVLANPAWSPDGKFLAVRTDKPLVETLIWETSFSKPPRTITGYTASITGLAWSPTDPILATSSADAAVGVKFWNAATGKDQPAAIHPYKAEVTAIAWSADGKLLATGGRAEKAVYVYELPSGRRVNELTGHAARVEGLAWLPDGRTLVARSEDTALVFWDTVSGQLSRRVPGRAGIWNFLPERGLLATGSFSYTVRFRDGADRPQATLLLLRQGQTDLALAVSPQGHYRASPRLEAELIYVVATKQGQQVVSPDEFRTQYGWVNDPGKVHLLQPGP